MKNIEEFIRYTNTQHFYQESNFNINKIETDINRNVTFDFVNEQEGNNASRDIEKWRITAHRCEKFYDMYRKISLPYIQLKLFKDHPLLWEYKSNILQCELIGYPKDINTFLGQIYQTYIQVSGNWIQATKHFYATEHAYKKNRRKTLTIPEGLKKSIEDICNIHNIKFEIKQKIENQTSKPKEVKVLIFNNDYISPDGFNIGQPYIIANDFSIEKIC